MDELLFEIFPNELNSQIQNTPIRIYTNGKVTGMKGSFVIANHFEVLKEKRLAMVCAALADSLEANK